MGLKMKQYSNHVWEDNQTCRQFPLVAHSKVFFIHNWCEVAKGSLGWHQEVVKTIHWLGNFSLYRFLSWASGMHGYGNRGFAKSVFQHQLSTSAGL